MTVGGESPPPGRAESGKVPHLEGGVVDREKERGCASESGDVSRERERSEWRAMKPCEQVGRCEPGGIEERVESDRKP